MKGLRELRHAANVAAGSAQPRSALSTSIFDVRGATGRRAMRRPRGVIRSQESRAPMRWSSKTAAAMADGSGASMASARTVEQTFVSSVLAAPGETVSSPAPSSMPNL